MQSGGDEGRWDSNCHLSVSWKLSEDRKSLALTLFFQQIPQDETTLTSEDPIFEFNYNPGGIISVQGEVSAQFYPNGTAKSLSAKGAGYSDLSPCGFDQVIAEFSPDEQ